MRQQDFLHSIRTSIATLQRFDVIFDIHKSASLKPSEEFLQVAHGGSQPYSTIYRTGLRNRDYNLLLTDFSYFQFAFGHNPLLNLRYAYYQNPYRAETVSELYESLEVNDWEIYMQLLDEEQEDVSSTVLRFDVAYRDYRECAHPAAHFTFGLQNDGRLAIDKVLSPHAFLLLSLKLGGATWWSDEADDLLIREKGQCSILTDVYFSARERSLFHVT